MVFRNKNKTYRSRVRRIPIFSRILLPMMLLILLELLIVYAAIRGTGVMPDITENSRKVAEGKLSSRKNYLESIMINNWMNLNGAVTDINSMMAERLSRGDLSEENIGQDEKAVDDFLVLAANRLITMMRTNRVTGAFLLLNTEDLEEIDLSREDMIPGLYIRDLDPTSAASKKNTDLLLARAPSSVVKETGIATDTAWSSVFRFRTQEDYYDFFAKPFETAYHNPGKYSWSDLGYWSAPYTLKGENRSTIAYSVPLILPDGQVYGVLGVDLTLDYIQTLLPAAELDADHTGAFFIGQAVQAEGADREQFTDLIIGGDRSFAEASKELSSGSPYDTSYLSIDTDKYQYSTSKLGIYNSNVPYSDTNWVIGQVLPWSVIKTNARSVRQALILSGILLFLMGVLGSFIIALKIRMPVRQMELQLKGQDSGGAVELRATGIREIDEMADAIEKLSRDVIDSSHKFSKILQMASEDLGGFQINEIDGSLFISDGFMDVIGIGNKNKRKLSIDEFRKILHRLDGYAVEEESNVEATVYEISKNGEKRYIRLKQHVENGITYGLAEDVTQNLLRKRLLLFERDHDNLTGLLNRKAFKVKFTEFMENRGSRFKCGALMMMDLDNLKVMNDTYGHERGDEYIRIAAQIISESAREDAYSARLSGDEFSVFFYGSSPEEIQSKIDRMREEFNRAVIQVGEGKTGQVRISAGISWYPRDGRSYDDLLRFADSALYVAKKNHRGEFETFDLESYQGEEEIRIRSAALISLLDQKHFHYNYQPIVSAKTGKLYAYEALLRSDMQEFASPVQILETARAEGKLGQVENVTIPAAIGTFFKYQEMGRFGQNVKLFFNSIANQYLTPETKEELKELVGHRYNRLVMEITEEEPLDYEGWEDKTAWLISQGGSIALDDYGTGYNSEKSLLSISPDIIKVDIAIIRNIENSADKQSIMRYIVNFAHERGKLILAEGVENREEVACCTALGADLLQGYYIGRPKEVPEIPGWRPVSRGL